MTEQRDYGNEMYSLVEGILAQRGIENNAIGPIKGGLIVTLTPDEIRGLTRDNPMDFAGMLGELKTVAQMEGFRYVPNQFGRNTEIRFYKGRDKK